MKLALPLLLLAASLSGCDKPSAPAPATAAPKIAPKTAIAAPAVEIMLAELPAMVVQPPGARVAVAAPFPGLVQEVLVQPGEAVKAGQVLAIIVSPQALILAGDLARAQSQARLAGAESARMQALAREGVVAGARADTANAAKAEADINTREAARLLSRGSADKDGLVRLRAPLKGRIASMSIEAGAPVDGTTAPFIVEAEGSRWLSLQIPARLAQSVKPGLPFTLKDGQRGTLITVAAGLDPATRAFPARARLNDKGAGLTSGALMQLMLHAPAPEGAVSVPSAALLQSEGKTQLFVKTAAGFTPRTVTSLGEGPSAIILSGLKAGDVVAISNLPELRAELQAAAAE